jgi:hypothetical protein
MQTAQFLGSPRTRSKYPRAGTRLEGEIHAKKKKKAKS